MIIQDMSSADERWRSEVTSSFIVGAHTQNGLWLGCWVQTKMLWDLHLLTYLSKPRQKIVAEYDFNFSWAEFVLGIIKMWFHLLSFIKTYIP